MFKKNQFLVISVLVHAVILYVLARSIMFPSGTVTPPEKPSVMKATLWFESPPKAEIPEQAIDEPEETLPPEPKALPQANDNEPVQSADLPPEPQSESLTPEPEPIKQEEVKPEQPAAKTPLPSKQSTTTKPVTNMARRHLNSFHQQQQARLAEQASRDFRQQQNSPIIDAPVKDRFKTEDEKFRESLRVKADCSSTGKKTAAMVLGILGGNIECSKPPPIKSFIQKHINKTALQPESRVAQKPKRPQSIVIDK